jgi:hypothetical protein
LVPKQTEKKVDPSPTKADQAKSGEPTLWQVATAIAAYSLCSSMMVVVNKLAIDAIQISAVVTQVQFTFATVTVLILGSVSGLGSLSSSFIHTSLRPHLGLPLRQSPITPRLLGTSSWRAQHPLLPLAMKIHAQFLHGEVRL